MTDLQTLLRDTDQRAISPALAMTEHGAVATVPASDTVLSVDRWGRRRGADLSREWQELEAGEVDSLVAADAHASLFEPSPALAERPKDASRAAWWRQLMDTAEYQSLRSQTVLDTSLSGLAAKSLCDQWLEYAAVQDEPELGDPMPGADNEPIADQVARIRSTSKALAEARETVDTAQDMAAGLGMGAGGEKLDHAKLAEYFRRVRSDSNLRRILEFAGKAIRRCRALQRTKINATRGELTGIELGGDVARLVPSEMAQVAGAVPELETLALYRLAQRRSLCYRHRKVEPRASGPIVIVVDESGSMNGEKIIAAKGIALALAWLARQQKRWTALVGFSGGTEGTRVACPPNATDQAAVIEWLEHNYRGGTNLDVPINQLPLTYWPEFVAQGLQRGRTGVILITDAIVRADDEMVDNYRKWASAEQVTSYGIIIGNDEAGDLAEICDRHWTIPDLDLESAAIEAVLSIYRERTMKTKTRWSWARWLDALERAELPEAAKSLGREIPPVMKLNRRALVPWELPSSPGYGEFTPLQTVGLLRLIPASGCFVPIIDPLPLPGSIKTTPAMRHILRLLLRGCLLDFTERDSRYSTPGWRMRRGWNGPTVKIEQRAAHRLLRLGLLEWNGCGNWPTFDHRCYRVAMRRSHGVHGFAAPARRWIKSRVSKTEEA